MTDRNKLLELADRCEKLKNPSDLLDTAIDETLNGASPAPVGGRWNTTPRYTASLDAVLTLVPEGHFWIVDGGGEDGGACCWPKDTERPDELTAATPALALCAAALRARSEQP